MRMTALRLLMGLCQIRLDLQSPVKLRAEGDRWVSGTGFDALFDWPLGHAGGF